MMHKLIKKMLLKDVQFQVVIKVIWKKEDYKVPFKFHQTTVISAKAMKTL